MFPLKYGNERKGSFRKKGIVEMNAYNRLIAQTPNNWGQITFSTFVKVGSKTTAYSLFSSLNRGSFRDFLVFIEVFSKI